MCKALAKKCPIAIIPKSENIWPGETIDPALVSGLLAQYDNSNPNILFCQLSEYFMPQFVQSKGPKIGFPVFEHNILQPEEISNLKSLDRTFVPSQWAKHIIEEANIETPVDVIHEGYNPEVFYPGKSEGYMPDLVGPRAVSIGKWETRKCQMMLIEALGNIKGPLTLFALWGNPFTPDWIQIARTFLTYSGFELIDKTWRKGDVNIVIINHLKTQEHVADLIRSVDFGIFPFRSEGWGLSILETMACGKPVIAGKWTGPSEFLSTRCTIELNSTGLEKIWDGVFFISPNLGWWETPCQETLESAIQSCINNPASIKVVGRATAKYAKSFTWEKAADSILALNLSNDTN